MPWLRSLHRWIGLVLAAMVVAVAASGGLLLLRDPYYRAIYAEFDAPITAAQIAARADVLTSVESRWQRDGITLIKFPRPGMNAYQVWLRDGREAFVNPHDGSVIDQWHWSTSLPAFLFELHAHLLADPPGTIVNGIVALVLLFMALTGVVLWWPARRAAFRLRAALPSRFTPSELLRSHAAVGALAALPIALFAATGAAIVFYDDLEVIVTGLLDRSKAEEPSAHVTSRQAPIQPWSQILASLDRTFPEGEIVFYYPGTAANRRLMFRKRLPGEWHPNGRSYVLIDPYESTVLQAIDARAQGRGTRLMHAIYPVHAAKVGGFWMIALAALTSTALTWLAIGGVWVFVARWLSRRRRYFLKLPQVSIDAP